MTINTLSSTDTCHEKKNNAPTSQQKSNKPRIIVEILVIDRSEREEIRQLFVSWEQIL